MSDRKIPPYTTNLDSLLGRWKVDVNATWKDADKMASHIETYERLMEQAPEGGRAILEEQLTSMRNHNTALKNSFIEIGSESITVSTLMVTKFHIDSWSTKGKKATAAVTAIEGIAGTGKITMTREGECLKVKLAGAPSMVCHREKTNFS